MPQFLHLDVTHRLPPQNRWPEAAKFLGTLIRHLRQIFFTSSILFALILALFCLPDNLFHAPFALIEMTRQPRSWRKIDTAKRAFLQHRAFPFVVIRLKGDLSLKEFLDSFLANSSTTRLPMPTGGACSAAFPAFYRVYGASNHT